MLITRKKRGDFYLKNLMQQYKLTATILYNAILKFKKSKKINNEKYNLLISQYQQACSIQRQIANYCKARGIL